MSNINKYIFCDLDGVCNSRDFFIHKYDKKLEYGKIDPLTIARLNEVYKVVPYKTVISSAWRQYYSLGKLQGMFQDLGLLSEVIDVTPSLFIGRGHEVIEWLNKANDRGLTIHGYCILDDNDEFPTLQYNFVKTDFDLGLQDKHIPKIINILNNKFDL